jgi:hypothetical protein
VAGEEDEGVETAARWKWKGSSNGTRRRRQREGMGSFVNLISAKGVPVVWGLFADEDLQNLKFLESALKMRFGICYEIQNEYYYLLFFQKKYYYLRLRL